jgi:uncharacterized membrane protein YozB (DUF420 family)
MEDLLHLPGFLGTSANLATDSALVMMVVVAALFTVGFGLARAQRYEAHRWVQTAGGLISLILVAWLMILPYRDFILPGIPARMSQPFYSLTTLHALAGLVALPFGLYVMLTGHKLLPERWRFENYKPYMRWAYGFFMTTIALGVAVYVVWFVTNPDPPVF